MKKFIDASRRERHPESLALVTCHMSLVTGLAWGFVKVPRASDK
jgi:hypothetical protein